MNQLKLEIIDCQATDEATTGCYSFDERGGSIGRGDNNDWVLKDERRYLSSTHASIFYDKQHFYLKDLSTNGVFLNGNTLSLKKSQQNPSIINNQTLIKMGLYTLKAEVINSESPFQFNSDNTDLSDLFSDDALVKNFIVDHTTTDGELPELQHAANLKAKSNNKMADFHLDHAIDAGSFDTLDPLEALALKHPSTTNNTNGYSQQHRANKALTLEDDIASNRSFIDHAFISSTKDKKHKNDNTPALLTECPPEDWDRDETDLGVEHAITDINTSPTPIAAISTTVDEAVQDDDIKPHKNRSTKSEQEKKSNEHTSLESTQMETVLKTLGFDTTTIDCGKVSQQWIDMMPLLVEGITDLLKMRRAIKKTFNVEETTIEIDENNPLKFSNDIKDTINDLFIQPRTGFIPIREAFQEAINDSTHHQQAMTAGFQQGLESFIQELSPEAIEKESADEKCGKHFLEKLKHPGKWSFYKQKYNAIMKYSNHSFINFFGNEFVIGYKNYIDNQK